MNGVNFPRTLITSSFAKGSAPGYGRQGMGKIGLRAGGGGGHSSPPKEGGGVLGKGLS